MSPNELKTEKDFEQAFQEAANSFTPPVGLEEAIADRLGQLRETPAKSGETKMLNTNEKPKTLRIFKWAMPSVAACAAAVLIAISFWPGDKVVKSAYAEMVEAIENSKSAEWVHLVQFSGASEMWLSLKSFQCFSKNTLGQVMFIDYGAQKFLAFDPAEKTVAMMDCPVIAGGTDQAAIIFEQPLSDIEEDRGRGAIIEKTMGELNGKPCAIYEVKFEHSADGKTLYIDVETNRLVRHDWRHLGQHVVTDFDYPENGPKDMYELGMPRDAKIVDKRTRDDQSNEMMAKSIEAESRFEKTFKAVVCSGTYDPETGEMVAEEIRAYYQGDFKRRDDEWRIGKPGSVDPNNIEELEEYMKSHVPTRVNMLAARGSIMYNLQRNEIRKTMMMIGGSALFTRLLWETCDDDYGRSVPDIQGAFGTLLGTQKIEPAIISDGVVSRLPYRITTYVNPARDYIVEKREGWAGNLDDPWVPQENITDGLALGKYVMPRKSTKTVLEYGKTPAGHWYPKKRLIEYRDTSEGVKLEVIHLDTTYECPEELFLPDVFESQFDRPMKIDGLNYVP